MTNFPVILTIDPSNSRGRAEIQAYLKTFPFRCVHRTSSITCVTAQNTLGVTQVQTISIDSVMVSRAGAQLINEQEITIN